MRGLAVSSLALGLAACASGDPAPGTGGLGGGTAGLPARRVRGPVAAWRPVGPEPVRAAARTAERS
jgi:hypothetical protein